MQPFVAAVLISLSSTSASQSDLAQELEQAKALYQSASFIRALQALGAVVRVLDERPDIANGDAMRVEGNLYLGLTYFALQDSEAAKESFANILQLRPSYTLDAPGVLRTTSVPVVGCAALVVIAAAVLVEARTVVVVTGGGGGFASAALGTLASSSTTGVAVGTDVVTSGGFERWSCVSKNPPAVIAIAVVTASAAQSHGLPGSTCALCDRERDKDRPCDRGVLPDRVIGLTRGLAFQRFGTTRRVPR